VSEGTQAAPTSSAAGPEPSLAAKPAQSPRGGPKAEPAKSTNGEKPGVASETGGNDSGAAKVVSIDAFRKR